MNWSRETLLRCIALAGIAMLLGGCAVPQLLSPDLPESAGTVSVGQSLSQLFLAPSDGLDGVTVSISPPLVIGGDLMPSPTGGATLSIRYAPEADDRFPDEAFHDWPASDQWLGELTGSQQIGQSFLSRYPGLNGITLRVATYGADTGTGQATLKQGPPRDVLQLPVDGDILTTLPAGSDVQVVGAAEGWAQISLGPNQTGYLPLDDFASLPAPSRHNTSDVTLSLYRDGDSQVLRRVSINAAQIHDNSHITFNFDPIADSDGQRYRFVVTSPDSTPGNAVTFRVQPQTSYAEGTRYADAQAVGGALVFRPDFSPAAPIYEAKVDTLQWSSLVSAFSGSFSPRQRTADRFLSVDLTPGTRPLSVHWSLIRPDGGLPIAVDGNNKSPGGGLVFNVRFQGQLGIGAVLREAGHSVRHDIRADPLFFVIYSLALLVLVGWFGWAGVRRLARGR
jgi:hypothetical protein